MAERCSFKHRLNYTHYFKISSIDEHKAKSPLSRPLLEALLGHLALEPPEENKRSFNLCHHGYIQDIFKNVFTIFLILD